MPARISEADLVMPALHCIQRLGPRITTTQLQECLRGALRPKGEDLEILPGRGDDKFSQKVRNLRSHKTLERQGLATYQRAGRNGYWSLTRRGRRMLAGRVGRATLGVARGRPRQRPRRRSWVRVTSPEDIRPPTWRRRGAIDVHVDLDVRQERTVEHQRVLKAVAREYRDKGFDLKYGNFDLLATRGRIAYLVEAKSITQRTERMRVRAAVGQLFVYSIDDAAELLRGKRVRLVMATNRNLGRASREILRKFRIALRVVT